MLLLSTHDFFEISKHKRKSTAMPTAGKWVFIYLKNSRGLAFYWNWTLDSVSESLQLLGHSSCNLKGLWQTPGWHSMSRTVADWVPVTTNHQILELTMCDNLCDSLCDSAYDNDIDRYEQTQSRMVAPIESVVPSDRFNACNFFNKSVTAQLDFMSMWCWPWRRAKQTCSEVS